MTETAKTVAALAIAGLLLLLLLLTRIEWVQAPPIAEPGVRSDERAASAPAAAEARRPLEDWHDVP